MSFRRADITCAAQSTNVSARVSCDLNLMVEEHRTSEPSTSPDKSTTTWYSCTEISAARAAASV